MIKSAIAFMLLWFTLTPAYEDSLGTAPSKSVYSGQLVDDSITGFGFKYYLTTVMFDSFVDVVLTVPENENSLINQSCNGWTLFLNVNNTKPVPEERYIETEQYEEYGRLYWVALLHATQQSLLCKRYSSARWSVKHAEPKTWWVLIQTRGGSPAYDNETCNFSVWVNTRERFSFLLMGWVCTIICLLWIFLLALITLRGLRGGIDYLATHYPSVPFPELVTMFPFYMARWLALNSYTYATEGSAIVRQWLSQASLSPCRVRRRLFGYIKKRGPQMMNDTEEGEISGTVPPIELQAEEEEDTCRICREGRSTNSEPLHQVCGCQGSLRFVHLTCLNRWCIECVSGDRPENAVMCEICHQNYRFSQAAPSFFLRIFGRICTRATLGILQFLLLFTAVYVTANFAVVVLGPCTCVAPYDVVDTDRNTARFWFMGVLYYFDFMLHLHICQFWCELQWMRMVEVNHLNTEQHPFWTWRMRLKIVGSVTAIFLAEIVIGYIAKFLLFVASASVVWTWDISLVMGQLAILLLLVVSALVYSLVIIGYNYLRRYRNMAMIMEIANGAPSQSSPREGEAQTTTTTVTRTDGSGDTAGGGSAISGPL